MTPASEDRAPDDDAEFSDDAEFGGDPVLHDDPELSDDALFQKDAELVYQELLDRVGEATLQPRLAPTRRVVELLGDPQRAYPIIHVTGTNGKTSTSRMIESILRASGLRTGLLTSPHLVRVNERIVIDGEPISNEDLAGNWADINPYVAMVDAELAASGQAPLTFFEAFTALAFASFADAPVDVAVIEVGMGGEWDSTNVGDGQVAVFTPISLDHTARLGNTIAKIAKTKSGIIKPAASVVSSVQTPEALAELTRAARLSESRMFVQAADFALLENTVAVGGQLVSIQGRAAVYSQHFLPLYGDHQAQNATVAIAAVETFIGDGGKPLAEDIVAEGFATVTSPGRLQVIGSEPTVILDAAHNPAGAKVLAEAIESYFSFDELAIVFGVLADKDARGIVSALAPIATHFHVTQSSSERAISASRLEEIVEEFTEVGVSHEFDELEIALDEARRWAAAAPRRAVLVTGSITMLGDTLVVAEQQGWKR